MPKLNWKLLTKKRGSSTQRLPFRGLGIRQEFHNESDPR